jgi:predicted RNA methylase
MRIIVRALLPLGEGTILDPFMGSGSTIAAAEAIGYESIGIEIDQRYFQLANEAVPRLAKLYPHFNGEETAFEANYLEPLPVSGQQIDFALAERPATRTRKLRP